MSIHKRRTYFVLANMTVGILMLVIDSIGGYGWVSAAWWGYGLAAVNIIYAVVYKDSVLKKFILFGLVAGFMELLPDGWLVDFTHTLYYPQDEPMLYKSPAYMPFSWTVVLLQIGYLGWLASYKFGIPKASIMLGVLGGAIIPLYEHWAINAGWWYYENAPMLLNVPYYIIIAEDLLMTTIPFMLRKVERNHLWQTFLWGAIEGLIVMWLACIIAYSIAG